MPKMTIYVRDEDTLLFEKAKLLDNEGSLSAVLAQALRDYLTKIEVLTDGFQPIELKIGYGLRRDGSGTFRIIRFTGKLAAKSIQENKSFAFSQYYNWYVYSTQKGGWVVLREECNLDDSFIPQYEATTKYWTARTVEELEQLANIDDPGVPKELIGLAKDAIGTVQDLDI